MRKIFAVICIVLSTALPAAAVGSAERSVEELRAVLALPELRSRLQGHRDFDAVLINSSGYDLILGDCTVSVVCLKIGNVVHYSVGPLICN